MGQERLHKYLTRRTALADLGEICALGNESGSGDSAAQIWSQ
jgi:hypothetical protein